NGQDSAIMGGPPGPSGLSMSLTASSVEDSRCRKNPIYVLQAPPGPAKAPLAQHWQSAGLLKSLTLILPPSTEAWTLAQPNPARPNSNESLIICSIFAIRRKPILRPHSVTTPWR